jgi:hypothetical protein
VKKCPGKSAQGFWKYMNSAHTKRQQHVKQQNLQQRAQAEPVSTPSHISKAKINPVEEPEDARPYKQYSSFNAHS